MSGDGVPCLSKCAFSYRILISPMSYIYNYYNNINRICINKSINANKIYIKIIQILKDNTNISIDRNWLK